MCIRTTAITAFRQLASMELCLSPVPTNLLPSPSPSAPTEVLLLPSLCSPSFFTQCCQERVKLFCQVLSVSSLSSFCLRNRLMGAGIEALSTFCNGPPVSFAPGQAAAGQPARRMEILWRESWKYAVTHLLFPSYVAQFSVLPQSGPF